MKIYSFKDGSPLSRVIIDTGGAKDGVRAFLYARKGAAPASLAGIRTALESEGMFVTVDVDDGGQLLRAYEIGEEEKVMSILRRSGIIPSAVADHDRDNRDKSLKENLSEVSARGAGIGFTVADLALIGSGYMSGRYKECATGGIFSVGSMLLARYGNKSSELHLNDISCKLGKYLKDSGYDLGAGVGPVTAERLIRCEGFAKRIESFMYSYPTQIFNGFVATAGLPLMMSGVQHRKYFDLLAGALITGGALAGLLIPEKKPEPTMPGEKKSAWSKAKEWIQEKPLRVSSIMWASNNFSMLASAIKEKERNPEQKSYIFKLSGVAANLVANAFTFISSKDEATNFVTDSRNISALEAIAVQMIMNQPEKTRSAAINQIAGFLSAQPEVKIPASVLSAQMQEKIAFLENSPWLDARATSVPEKHHDEKHHAEKHYPEKHRADKFQIPARENGAAGWTKRLSTMPEDVARGAT